MKNGKRIMISSIAAFIAATMYITTVSAQEIKYDSNHAENTETYNDAGELVLGNLDGIDKPLADFDEEGTVPVVEEGERLGMEVESEIETEEKRDLSEQTFHVRAKRSIFTKKKDLVKNRGMLSSEDPTGYNDPNSAIYYSSGLFGEYIDDVANKYENWYCFKMTETQKLSIHLRQPTSGDYDIYLYKLEDSALTNVGYSAYGGLDEQLSYIASSGFYYLRVVPHTASETASFYTLRIDTLTQYDSGEADDNLCSANVYTNSINVNQTIDNTHDVDSFLLKVNQAKDYSITLSKVPSDAKYVFMLYNSDMSLKGSFISKGSKTRTIALKEGSYYVQIFSYNGTFSASKSYKLNMTPTAYYPNVAGGYRILTKGGQTLEVTSNAAYINGRMINLNWEYRFQTNEEPYYTRTQGLHTSSNTSIHISSVKTGSFTGSNASSENAVCLAVDNVWYSYYYLQSGGSDHIYDTVDFNDGEYIYVYIDADTGSIIDTDINYEYVALGYPKTFDE